LLEKAGLINDKDAIISSKLLDDILSHDVAEFVGLPPSATQNSLLLPSITVAFSISNARVWQRPDARASNTTMR
jgi:hypothetical protein